MMRAQKKEGEAGNRIQLTARTAIEVEIPPPHHLLNQFKPRNTILRLMRGKKALLKKMEPDSRAILEEYIWEKAKSVRFFSYGSNMNEKKFKRDMKGKIGLVNKTTATLAGFKRTLSNKSEKHGAAFSICCSSGDAVEGICHDIPIELLEDFLKKEGVLKGDASSYRLIKVSIPYQNEPILTLCGLKPVSLDELSVKEAKRTLNYVKESIQGAKCCDAEHSDMIEMEKKLQDLIRTKGKHAK